MQQKVFLFWKAAGVDTSSFVKANYLGTRKQGLTKLKTLILDLDWLTMSSAIEWLWFWQLKLKWWVGKILEKYHRPHYRKLHKVCKGRKWLKLLVRKTDFVSYVASLDSKILGIDLKIQSTSMLLEKIDYNSKIKETEDKLLDVRHFVRKSKFPSEKVKISIPDVSKFKCNLVSCM